MKDSSPALIEFHFLENCTGAPGGVGSREDKSAARRLVVYVTNGCYENTAR
jgi:hypothetical protein